MKNWILLVSKYNFNQKRFYRKFIQSFHNANFVTLFYVTESHWGRLVAKMDLNSSGVDIINVLWVFGCGIDWYFYVWSFLTNFVTHVTMLGDAVIHSCQLVVWNVKQHWGLILYKLVPNASSYVILPTVMLKSYPMAKFVTSRKASCNK